MWAKLPKIIMLDRPASELCCRPYPGRKDGCPNFNVKKGCPPNPIHAALPADENYYVIFNKYSLAVFAAKMKSKHPKWTNKQCRCCRYWQGTARKQLREIIKEFHREHIMCIVYQTPEALGVNVTATMATIGIKLDWPPKEFAYQVVLAKQI